MPTEFITGETQGWRSPWVTRWNQAAWGAVLIGVGLALTANLTDPPHSPSLLRIDAAVWMTFALSATVNVWRTLPLQNAIAVALISLFGTWGMGVLESLPGVGIPRRVPSELFGGFISTTVTGGMLAVGMWIIPCTRGTARWIVARRTNPSRLGLAQLAVTWLLAGILGTLIEVTATRAGWWHWQGVDHSSPTTKIPWVGWLDWAVLTVLLYFPTTPWLLNKRPVRRFVDVQPPILLTCLVGWLLMTLWLHASEANGHPAR